MKKILFILALFAVTSVSAIDRFVDPNLGSGNGTTLFTTVTSAVNAAVNGDRILIVAGTYNEPTLTLNKSLVIIPQVAGTYVNYNGNITIGGFPGMNLSILGFRLGIYSVTANAITGGSASNRAVVNFVDSRMTNLTIDQNYYDLLCARCQTTESVIFRFGSYIASKTNDFYLTDEPLINQSGFKNSILCDTINNLCEIRNDDYPVFIANNSLLNLHFFRWNSLSSNINFIRNNNFNNNAQILFGANPPGYNFEFSSNLFLGTLGFSSNTPCGNAGVYGFSVYRCSPEGCAGCSCCAATTFSSTSSLFPQPAIAGFFKWIYNGIDLPCTVPSGSDPMVLTKIIGTIGTNVNTGNPNHEYYDIDLTINDRGRTGGPYSILNYNPTFNPSNGKAYVFDLEIPADLFPGQQVDIKAKGYHRN